MPPPLYIIAVSQSVSVNGRGFRRGPKVLFNTVHPVTSLLTKLHCFFWLLSLGLAQCHHDDPTPLSQLPPASQTGAGTFGCLINGRAYTPKGNNGTTNFAVLYEPGPQGVGLNILTYRIDGGRQYLSLSCGLITPQKRTFTIGLPATEGDAAYDGVGGDYFNDNGLTYRRGQIIITRLDEQAGVLSGTFEFTSVRRGGDTLKVTQGRFDSRL